MAAYGWMLGQRHKQINSKKGKNIADVRRIIQACKISRYNWSYCKTKMSSVETNEKKAEHSRDSYKSVI